MKAFIALLLLSSSSLVIAQDSSADKVRIGFVNIRKLITQAPQLPDIQKKLVAKFDEENKTIVKLRQEITSLDPTGRSLGKAELLAAQKVITKKQAELGRLQQALQDEYNLYRNEALGELQSLIVATVAKVSQEKRLDIVLNNTGIIYVSGRIDITNDVLRKLAEQVID